MEVIQCCVIGLSFLREAKTIADDVDLSKN